jgi:hypothetical protein
LGNFKDSPKILKNAIIYLGGWLPSHSQQRTISTIIVEILLILLLIQKILMVQVLI